MRKKVRLVRLAIRMMARIGREAILERGFGHEDMVFEAFSGLGEMALPEWFRCIGRGTEHQDSHKGIDFVVQTDVGKIFVQIKSSKYIADKFRLRQISRRYSRYIVVVIIDDNLKSHEAVRLKILSGVSRMRDVFLAKRVWHMAA